MQIPEKTIESHRAMGIDVRVTKTSEAVAEPTRTWIRLRPFIAEHDPNAAILAANRIKTVAQLLTNQPLIGAAGKRSGWRDTQRYPGVATDLWFRRLSLSHHKNISVVCQDHQGHGEATV